MKNITLLSTILLCVFSTAAGQKRLQLGNQIFELHNVTGSVIKFEGQNVLKIERDLNAIPFDSNNVERTVDEAHYAKLLDLDV
jgi:hypothetical protein